MSKLTAVAVCVGLTAITIGGCSGRGLPETGPEPGEVDVGYGTKKGEEVTGAVSTVTEQDRGVTGPLKFEDWLRGRVPGLEVTRRADGRVSFRIRGINSLQTHQEPLFIVDGVPVESNNVAAALNAIPPEDIKQVDVLKDVASTSVYGMRGAGGVIIINTRR